MQLTANRFKRLHLTAKFEWTDENITSRTYLLSARKKSRMLFSIELGGRKVLNFSREIGKEQKNGKIKRIIQLRLNIFIFLLRRF